MLFKGINVVSICVPDLEAAKVFYGQTLGLGEPELDMPDIGWAEFNTGATSGNLSVTTAEAGWQPSDNITVVLNVDNCHTACQQLRAKGVRCDDPVGIPGVITYCSFYDPFGNRLQMCSPPPG